MEYGASDDEAIGALLHDAAEDGGGEARLAEIRARFGDAVGDIVFGCSDRLVEHPEDKLPWRERKEGYLAHVEGASTSVCLVSAPDTLHNVRSIIRDLRMHGDEVWERFQGKRDGTLWYYGAVADALLRRHRLTLALISDAVAGIPLTGHSPAHRKICDASSHARLPFLRSVASASPATR